LGKYIFYLQKNGRDEIMKPLQENLTDRDKITVSLIYLKDLFDQSDSLRKNTEFYTELIGSATGNHQKAKFHEDLDNLNHTLGNYDLLFYNKLKDIVESLDDISKNIRYKENLDDILNDIIKKCDKIGLRP